MTLLSGAFRIQKRPFSWVAPVCTIVYIQIYQRWQFFWSSQSLKKFWRGKSSNYTFLFVISISKSLMWFKVKRYPFASTYPINIQHILLLQHRLIPVTWRWRFPRKCLISLKIIDRRHKTSSTVIFRKNENGEKTFIICLTSARQLWQWKILRVFIEDAAAKLYWRWSFSRGVIGVSGNISLIS